MLKNVHPESIIVLNLCVPKILALKYTKKNKVESGESTVKIRYFNLLLIKIIKQTQISEEIGEFHKRNKKFNKHIKTWH